MARSLSGGTRGFLRGRVANDLYQITTATNGRKVQLVRSVEDSRINNNTISQAMARMQMALCMGSLSSFKEIVDHSFEGVEYGLKSLNHFVSVNVKRIQEDCREHWMDGFLFDYPVKGSSVVRCGSFVIAEGRLTLPASISRWSKDSFGSQVGFSVSLGRGPHTMADLKNALGVAANDYITHCAFAQGTLPQFSGMVFGRTYINPNFPDTQRITLQNVAQCFLYEGNIPQVVEYYDAWGRIDVRLLQLRHGHYECYSMDCIILSKWNGRVWQRNNAVFLPALNFDDYNFDWVSPHDVFQSWFPQYDPDNNDTYPL